MSLLRFTLLASISLLLLVTTTQAQQNPWSDIREADIQANQDDRQIIPNEYRTVHLEFDQLRLYLQAAPSEPAYYQGTAGLLLEFPMPDGSAATFEVWEAPVMAPELTAKFPKIRSYAGKSLDQPGMLARFDISPYGFHAMFLNTTSSTIFIDPYARGNNDDYIVYFKKDFVKRKGNVVVCHVNEQIEIELPAHVTDRAGDCGNRREYRLALACTGEYANYHGSFGSDKAPALAAMNTSMTRVNGVYERDLSIRMNIVANNEDIIFTDPATDPYTNGNGSQMLGQNQTTCDAIIGSSNYDIGHVFSTGGGGIASLACVCNNSSKARGVTGLPNPVGDTFDIDYVCHEMGHQFGAHHTQYNDGCNRVNSSAMEPGSASTIMGYAGICDPNVQMNSDDYFHARNLQQIGAFVTTGGNSCAVKIATGNSAPSVPNLNNYTIPKSTPFLLVGSATDPNGDPLSFCWEQTDAWSVSTQDMPPQSTNVNGPMFRTFQPQSSSNRYCPRLNDVLSGFNFDWEELPSIGRTLSWRLTARDNNPAGGCTTEKNMTVTTSNSIGPFLVTAPNGGESYPSNSTQTITWDVAGTTNSPVSCANVNILLSTDGGNSFNTILAGTPNDGSQAVTFNAPVTNQARIMIQAVGNIFYDVSDANFSFSQPLPVELIAFDASAQGRQVRLLWKTASENNNRGFSVERSMNDATAFSAIGWVDGHGTVQTAQDYSFVDTDVRPGVVYYYRLRQTDFDGQIRYSPIRAVALEGADAALPVIPNPSHEKIQVKLPLETPELEGRVFILNSSGTVLLEQAVFSENLELDISGLAPGAYFLLINLENRVYRGAFVRS